MTWEVIKADARELPLEDESVDLIVTSPPYFALRSYRDEGEHYDGQIGSEDTPAEFVAALMECFTECRRVLKPSGSLWVNLGDKYAGSSGVNNWGTLEDSYGTPRPSRKRRSAENAKPIATDYGGVRQKSLMGLPWRVAIAMIDDGWILRAEVIWSKPNGLPESATDRVRRSHEQWFHFTREPRYFSAVDELREPSTNTGPGRLAQSSSEVETQDSNDGLSHRVLRRDPEMFNPLGRLPGSVWTIPTEPLQVPDHLGIDHFAAFPQEWPRRIIMGWCPEGGTVLDPFGGTGTTAGVAHMLGCHGISVDLSADYCRLAEWRIGESDHFQKTLKRTTNDRQGSLAF